MEWSAEENTRSILNAVAHAAAEGAQLCVFPELAVTGFHRQIRAQATPDLVESRLRAIEQACAAHSVAAAVGAPTFGDGGRVFNSCVLLTEYGERVGSIEKNGLTPAEETFLTRGTARPAHDLLARPCTAVLCREIEDLLEVRAQLSGVTPELIFWPGAMRPAVDGSEPDPEAHVKKAQQLALGTKAFIVQANWPNSLNYPEESTYAGQSVVISPAGEVLMRLPVAEAGVAVFLLGESAYGWFRQDAER